MVIPVSNTSYNGTDFEVVPASEPIAGETEYALGIIDYVAGKGFGCYADCGIVHEEGDDHAM